MNKIRKSAKLADVCYDIRGPVLDEAKRLEQEGYRVMKLNLGNPAPFGFDMPEEILQDVMRNLQNAQGYTDSKGIHAARKAVMQSCQQKNIPGVGMEDIYIGNGVSELINMAAQGLLNDSDEVLIPMPDYPLWTAVVRLSGGKPLYYRCNESEGWAPDPDHIRSLITKRTRALVIINPNNPTGAVYSRATLMSLLEIAREHQLVVLADEIYSEITYDDAVHIPVASIADDQLVITFNGLSKNYRAAGFRAGWMVLSGAREQAQDFIEGLDILSAMRLCANVPAQYGIQTALGGYQSVKALVEPGGLWHKQRDLACSAINQMPGLSCTKPEGALYVFPRIDPDVIKIYDDEQMVLDFLRQAHVLIVQGTAFNYPTPDHFRIVFLPREPELTTALERMTEFFGSYSQSALKKVSG